ncbi:MAG TPA: glycosyltransferase family 39 protein [Thermoanaerobaculaceae bacterium]|nr:glycosyltransferase family 39 protein [Thermoanaerobaculaceae bacterium]HRS16039.1 glycosyltransferase family 39 protein [Thermoanaerobaculaceae bacterium]
MSGQLEAGTTFRERVVRAALVGLCGWHCLALAFVFLRAAPFPYELEWMEGASLGMAHRASSGLPMYTPPSIEHTPVAYPPLYFLLGSVLVRWLGAALPALRALSLVAFGTTAAGMAWLVRRETTSWTAALAAVGCYAACFEASGAWYHLARVDSLFVCLVWWGLVALSRARSHRGMLAAALLFFAAFLTKQTLLLLLPFLLGLAIVGKRRWVATFAGSLGAGVGLAIFVGNRSTGGWFRYYILDMHAQRGFDLGLLAAYGRQFWLPLALLAGAVALAWARGGRGEGVVRRQVWPWLVATAGCLAVSGAAIAQPGGAANNAMPLYVCLATLAGLGFASFRREAGHDAFRTGYCLLLAGALAALWYDPGRYTPRAADYAAGRRVVEALAALPDPVWIPHTPSYYFLTGHRPFAHQVALWDVGKSDAVGAKRELVDQILAAIGRRAFSGVVLGRDEGLVHAALRQYGYRPVDLHPDPAGLWTRTGFRWRPEVLFLRDPAAGSGGGAVRGEPSRAVPRRATAGG